LRRASAAAASIYSRRVCVCVLKQHGTHTRTAALPCTRPRATLPAQRAVGPSPAYLCGCVVHPRVPFHTLAPAQPRRSARSRRSRLRLRARRFSPAAGF
jgi:hypothetical protein